MGLSRSSVLVLVEEEDVGSWEEAHEDEEDADGKWSSFLRWKWRKKKKISFLLSCSIAGIEPTSYVYHVSWSLHYQDK